VSNEFYTCRSPDSIQILQLLLTLKQLLLVHCKTIYSDSFIQSSRVTLVEAPRPRVLGVFTHRAPGSQTVSHSGPRAGSTAPRPSVWSMLCGAIPVLCNAVFVLCAAVMALCDATERGCYRQFVWLLICSGSVYVFFWGCFCLFVYVCVCVKESLSMYMYSHVYICKAHQSQAINEARVQCTKN
jgi:hypothetical protein